MAEDARAHEKYKHFQDPQPEPFVVTECRNFTPVTSFPQKTLTKIKKKKKNCSSPIHGSWEVCRQQSHPYRQTDRHTHSWYRNPSKQMIKEVSATKSAGRCLNSNYPPSEIRAQEPAPTIYKLLTQSRASHYLPISQRHTISRLGSKANLRGSPRAATAGGIG